MLRQGGVEEGLEVRGPSYNPGVGTDGVKGKNSGGQLDRACSGGPGAENTPSCSWNRPLTQSGASRGLGRGGVCPDLHRRTGEGVPG